MENIMDMQTTGQLIQEFRKKQQLTQQELASELGMSRSTISLIESGSIKEIGVRKLSQVCARVGLTLEARPNKIPTLEEAQISNAIEEAEALKKASAMINDAFQPRK